MRFFFKNLLVAAFAVGLYSSCLASSIDVKARLDSVNIVMGGMTHMKVVVSQPKGVKGSFTLLSRIGDNGIIPVCGDSVEFRAPASIDTVENAGRLSITYAIPVQSFDSGYYRLPELEFISGRDTAKSKNLYLKVIPVPASASDPINDYASVAPPENPSVFDWIPDWMVDFWWLVILVILVLAGSILLWKRYRKEGHLLPKKPEPTPYEKAVKALAALKEKKLWEQGMEKEYYTELTDILRVYLHGRFGINAMEMTSRQILASISRNDEIKDNRPYFKQILDMADFVKFAKVRPLPDDNVLAYENARNFVEQTKPRPAEIQDGHPDSKSDVVKSGVNSSTKGGKG